MDHTYEYIYEDDNITQKLRDGNVVETYTYDDHPNPYERIRIPDDLFTLSKNNLLTINGDTIARYEYNGEGFVSRAFYPNDVTIRFFYREDNP